MYDPKIFDPRSVMVDRHGPPAGRPTPPIVDRRTTEGYVMVPACDSLGKKELVVMNELRSMPATAEKVSMVMDFSVSLGEEILVRGGELWRVETILNDIFRSYGLKGTSIFLLPHTLLISTKNDGQEPIIRQRTIGSIMVNMEELSRLNTLIRQVQEAPPEPSELDGLLKKAIEGKTYSEPMTVFGMVIALLSLNYIIGGDWRDAIFIAMGITIVMSADMYFGASPDVNKLVVCGTGSFLIGLIDMAAWRLGLVLDPYHIMIVTAIGLVPGIPLINSCRELLCGRVLGGAMLFMTAFMETLFVVFGFAIAISLLGG